MIASSRRPLTGPLQDSQEVLRVTRPHSGHQRFRPATLDDVRQLAELDRVCFPMHAFPADLIRRFVDLGLPSAVVEDPGSSSIIAFAMLMPEYDEGTGALMTIDVDPDHRRQGLGTQLVRWSAGHLLGMEAPMWLMWLTVAARNKGAQAFYRALDFQKVDTIEGYYKDDNAIVMVHNDLESLAGDDPVGR